MELQIVPVVLGMWMILQIQIVYNVIISVLLALTILILQCVILVVTLIDLVLQDVHATLAM